MIKTIKDLKSVIESRLSEADIVIITPHRGADCDALAASLAATLIARTYHKPSYIVINEDISCLERAVLSIKSELPDDVLFIKESELGALVKKKHALLIAVDTNKKELIPLSSFKEFKDIIIIDHHDIGETTLETDDIYIDLNSSSASEIFCKLLEAFQIKYDSRIKGSDLTFNLANYLLAGINLDTSKFTKNTSSSTMKTVGYLMNKGADLNYVNELFMSDFESDKIILDLVRYSTWKLFNIAIALNNENPNFIYNKEALAKAADFIMNYKNVDAAFAIGLIEPETVYVSGRSKGVVDIGGVMSQLGGGGNPCAGAARFDECSDVHQIKLRLDDVIRPGYKIKDDKLEN